MGRIAFDNEGFVTLLDTNVLIYASDVNSVFHAWACDTISSAVTATGAAINTVILAELCVGDREPDRVAERIRGWGVEILDLPSAVSVPCAQVYANYRRRRASQAGGKAPAIPLPDFFIGAHALIMGWTIATADEGRFRSCFPTVPLLRP